MSSYITLCRYKVGVLYDLQRRIKHCSTNRVSDGYSLYKFFLDS